MSEAVFPNGVMEADMSAQQMQDILSSQKRAYLNDGVVSTAVRINRLERAIHVLKSNQKEFIDAMNSDFGHRSEHQSLFTDIASSIGPLRHAQKHLAGWQKKQKRKVTPGILSLLGAKAWVEYQPLGVVGVISPWNFPVNLAFMPLAGILSAGNRCMIKPSEYTPETSKTMAIAIAKEFDVDEIAMITGGPEVGANFSELAFDHLLFTGATSVAKHVMRAAANNLVPVTLELGGKSPVVISRSGPMTQATDALMAGKMLNAGQICLAPDYVFVPQERMGEFVESTKQSVAKMYPTLVDNPDYTSVVNDRHFERINQYVAEAKEAGVEVVEINPADEDFRQQPSNKIAPTLLIDPPEHLSVMQEEIFGPVMPIKPYSDLNEAIDYVNNHERPLGLYYFGKEQKEADQILGKTTSGGVTINDVLMHYAQDNLPFGGVGSSGTGTYHGEDGFRTFSHAKAVFQQAKFNPAEKLGLRPPYGDKLLNLLKGQMK
jgi:coniferyl-aldehyde dehydrogenase